MIFILENFISDWLRDILVVFIVITFLEIFLPKGKMKRFVNFIIGLLIIFVIISPFTDLESLQFNIDMNTDNFINSSDNESILNEHEERVKTVFTNSLNEEVVNLVEQNSNYQVIDMDIDTVEDQDTLLIQEVSLTIKNNEDNKREEITIDQVQIVEDHRDEVEKNHDDIQNLIADHLGVDKSIIHINEVD